MSNRRKYDQESRQRAVRMYLDRLGEVIFLSVLRALRSAGCLGSMSKHCVGGSEPRWVRAPRQRLGNRWMRWGVPRFLDSLSMREDLEHGRYLEAEVQSAVQS